MIVLGLIVFPIFVLDVYDWRILSIAGALVGLPIGAVVGYSQRRVLPPQLEWAAGWTWATALGYALGGSLAVTMFGWLADQGGGGIDPIAAAMLGPFSSVGIGVGQWLLLRHHVQRAGLWIVATVLAWGAGAIIALILNTLLPLILSRDQISGWAMWSVLFPYASIPGLLTGLLWRRFVDPLAKRPKTP